MPLMRCRCCNEYKALPEFPVRRDLVIPVPRSECKNCRRKAQNVRRHGVAEVVAPPPLQLDGFLPMPGGLPGVALVYPLGYGRAA